MTNDGGDTHSERLDLDRTTLGSVERTVKRLQSLLSERVPSGFSAVDELIAEREDAAQSE